MKSLGDFRQFFTHVEIREALESGGPMPPPINGAYVDALDVSIILPYPAPEKSFEFMLTHKAAYDCGLTFEVVQQIAEAVLQEILAILDHQRHELDRLRQQAKADFARLWEPDLTFGELYEIAQRAVDLARYQGKVGLGNPEDLIQAKRNEERLRELHDLVEAKRKALQ
jgi:hypothetical protein